MGILSALGHGNNDEATVMATGIANTADTTTTIIDATITTVTVA
jgi:hypothetical protein